MTNGCNQFCFSVKQLSLRSAELRKDSYYNKLNENNVETGKPHNRT